MFPCLLSLSGPTFISLSINIHLFFLHSTHSLQQDWTPIWRGKLMSLVINAFTVSWGIIIIIICFIVSLLNIRLYKCILLYSFLPGVDTVDYNLYPSVEFQYKWLRNYLSHFSDKNEAQIEEKEVEQYYIWTNKFALVSHLFWGCWALVQAHYSKIDFDFLE